jgi:hypothetical protein
MMVTLGKQRTARRVGERAVRLNAWGLTLASVTFLID